MVRVLGGSVEVALLVEGFFRHPEQPLEGGSVGTGQCHGDSVSGGEENMRLISSALHTARFR
jgi:hypothetical protein